MGRPTCGDLNLADLGNVVELDREADVVQCGYEAGGTVHFDVDHVRPVKRRLCREATSRSLSLCCCSSASNEAVLDRKTSSLEAVVEQPH